PRRTGAGHGDGVGPPAARMRTGPGTGGRGEGPSRGRWGGHACPGPVARRRQGAPRARQGRGPVQGTVGPGTRGAETSAGPVTAGRACVSWAGRPETAGGAMPDTRARAPWGCDDLHAWGGNGGRPGAAGPWCDRVVGCTSRA